MVLKNKLRFMFITVCYIMALPYEMKYIMNIYYLVWFYWLRLSKQKNLTNKFRKKNSQGDE